MGFFFVHNYLALWNTKGFLFRFEHIVNSTLQFIIFKMDLQLLIQTLLQRIEQLEARIKYLEAENAVLKNRKNSNNSHIPHRKTKTAQEKIKVYENLPIEK